MNLKCTLGFQNLACSYNCFRIVLHASLTPYRCKPSLGYSPSFCGFHSCCRAYHSVIQVLTSCVVSQESSIREKESDFAQTGTCPRDRTSVSLVLLSGQLRTVVGVQKGLNNSHALKVGARSDIVAQPSFAIFLYRISVPHRLARNPSITLNHSIYVGAEIHIRISQPLSVLRSLVL